MASDSSTVKRYVPTTRKSGAVGQNWRQLGGWSRNMVEMLLGFVVVDMIVNRDERGMLNISRLFCRQKLRINRGGYGVVT